MARDQVVLVTGPRRDRCCHCRPAPPRGFERGRGQSSRHGDGPMAPIVMDVDDDTSVTHAMDEILATHHRLDAVVACAGFGTLAGAVEQTPLDEAKAQMETNFWGAVRVVQARLSPYASSGPRAHRAGQFDRRCSRHSVPGLLQRQQVRHGGLRRGPGLRGRSLRASM